jgi:hypothetical protein
MVVYGTFSCWNNRIIIKTLIRKAQSDQSFSSYRKAYDDSVQQCDNIRYICIVQYCVQHVHNIIHTQCVIYDIRDFQGILLSKCRFQFEWLGEWILYPKKMNWICVTLQMENCRFDLFADETKWFAFADIHIRLHTDVCSRNEHTNFSNTFKSWTSCLLRDQLQIKSIVWMHGCCTAALHFILDPRSASIIPKSRSWRDSRWNITHAWYNRLCHQKRIKAPQELC